MFILLVDTDDGLRQDFQIRLFYLVFLRNDTFAFCTQVLLFGVRLFYSGFWIGIGVRKLRAFLDSILFSYIDSVEHVYDRKDDQEKVHHYKDGDSPIGVPIRVPSLRSLTIYYTPCPLISVRLYHGQ